MPRNDLITHYETMKQGELTMKSVIFAYTLLAAVTSFIFINSSVISNHIDNTSSRLNELTETVGDETLYEDVSEIYEEFKEKEKYISLTVSHEDLTNIETYFCQLVSAAQISEENDYKINLDLLKDALAHLERLCDMNLDSIL